MRSTRFLVVSILLHTLGVMALTLSPRSITPETSPGTVEVKIDEVSGQSEQAAAQAKAIEPETAKTEPITKATPVKAAPIKAQVKKVAVVATPSEDSEVAVVDTAETSESTQEDSEQPVAIEESAPAGVDAAVAEDTQEEPAQAAKPAAAAVGGSTKESAVSYLDLKQMAGNRPPTYPMQARLESRQGTLELLYRVTRDGMVTDIQIAKSSGSKDLDASAVAAISNFKFVPGQEGWARHPIVFSLKGAVATVPSRLRVNSGKQAQSE